MRTLDQNKIVSLDYGTEDDDMKNVCPARIP